MYRKQQPTRLPESKKAGIEPGGPGLLSAVFSGEKNFSWEYP
jgi:hypothetical protein